MSGAMSATHSSCRSRETAADRPLLPARPDVFSQPLMTDELEQGTAVYVNFPVQLLDNIEFVHPQTGAPVFEFWYDVDGRIYYDTPAKPEGLKYARLVTKSSMYDVLGGVLMKTSLAVSSLATQANFAAACMSSSESANVAMLPSVDLTPLYPLLLSGKCILWFLVAWCLALRRLEADFSKGDVMRETRRIDKAKTMLNIFFFITFNVQNILTDVSILLHIRRPVQPFAVFKSKGCRAWVLAWPTKEQHEVENSEGGRAQLTAALLFDVPLTLLMILMEQGGPTGWSYGAIVTLALSIIIVLSTAVNLFALLKSRRVFHATLVRRTEGGLLAAKEGGETALKELFVSHRLLEQHFGEPVPAAVELTAKDMGFMK